MDPTEPPPIPPHLDPARHFLSFEGAWPRLGQWLFRRRGWLGGPLFALILALCWETPRVGWAWGVGVAAMGAGQGLRLWIRLYIGRSSDTRKDKLRLITTGGPYRWSRNPLYLVNLLLVGGFALACGSWPLAVGAAVLLLTAYLPVMAYEEALMRRLHPDSGRLYQQAVARLIGRPGAIEPTAPKIGWGRACYYERYRLLGLLALIALASLCHATVC